MRICTLATQINPKSRFKSRRGSGWIRDHTSATLPRPSATAAYHCVECWAPARPTGRRVNSCTELRCAEALSCRRADFSRDFSMDSTLGPRPPRRAPHNVGGPRRWSSYTETRIRAAVFGPWRWCGAATSQAGAVAQSGCNHAGDVPAASCSDRPATGTLCHIDRISWQTSNLNMQ